MWRLRNPIVGALLNFFVFGSADLCVGQVPRAILKFLVYIAFLLAGSILVDRLQPSLLADVINVGLLLLYTFFALWDGYRAVVRANR